MARTWKCFDRDRRIRLDTLADAGHSKQEMAAILGCHISTIYRELKRGRCKQRDSQWREYYVYSFIVAHDDCKKKRANCGAPRKLGGNLQLASYIERRIMVDHCSPAAVAAELRHSDLGYLCADTIYRCIRQRAFDSLRPSHLPEHGIRKHPIKPNGKNKGKKKQAGRSIDERPTIVDTRSTFGHWEMDCVTGKRKGTNESILVLTERKTRAELIFKLPRKDSDSVVEIVDRLSRNCNFRKIFKSITMDNGSEFAQARRIERTRSGKRRTYCYYCHPYTSCERGSNENANRMIRRWYAKGRSLASVTSSDCLRLSVWMNTYPRRLLG